MKSLTLTLLFFIIGLSGCDSNDDMSTNTFSTTFKSDSEKIAFMKKYYIPQFNFEDVEYHIMYHDNESGRSIPGPSDWTMFFAFKLDDIEIRKMIIPEETKELNVDDWESFLPKSKKWNLEHPKKHVGNDILIEANDILLVKVSTN